MARTKSFQQDILSARKPYGFRPNSDVCLKKTLTKHCNVKMIYLVAEWMQLHAQFFVLFPISTGVCVHLLHGVHFAGFRRWCTYVCVLCDECSRVLSQMNKHFI